MTWVLVHGDRVVARGSYASVLDTAEDWMVLERVWSMTNDGTWAGSKLARGWMVLPEAMAGRLLRRAA